jgi:hypothetical protein
VDAEKRLQSKSRQLTSTHYTLLRIQVNILVVYYCWIVESADLQVPIVNDFFLIYFHVMVQLALDISRESGILSIVDKEICDDCS